MRDAYAARVFVRPYALCLLLLAMCTLLSRATLSLYATRLQNQLQLQSLRSLRAPPAAARRGSALRRRARE